MSAEEASTTEYMINNVKFIYRNKLSDFGAEPHSGMKAEKVVYIFSNRILTSDENDVLKFGLDFGLPSKKTKFL